VSICITSVATRVSSSSCTTRFTLTPATASPTGTPRSTPESDSGAPFSRLPGLPITLSANTVGRGGQSHCCLPHHFSASKLIFLRFHIELIRVIMHASLNRFKIGYFHKKCRLLLAQTPHEGLRPWTPLGHGPQMPVLALPL